MGFGVTVYPTVYRVHFTVYGIPCRVQGSGVRKEEVVELGVDVRPEVNPVRE